LRQLAPAPVDDVGPLDYARRLVASNHSHKAAVFLAHLLPRREAVWWARQCVGAILGKSGEDDALRAAELWVRAPDEENRRAALDLGNARDKQIPTTWLALAAGWSGGSLTAPDQNPLPPPPSACAKAANAAIILAACSAEPPLITPWIVACVDAGVRFAEGGEAQVVAPEPVDAKPTRPTQPRR
jgi:hypothetical protein